MIRIETWGTCGSITSPGRERKRHGGNTSCVRLVGYQDDSPGAYIKDESASVILDGGTGLLALQDVLMAGAAGRGKAHLHVVLSHYHWDHIIGLPLFAPLFVPGNQVSLYGSSESDLRGCVETLFTSAYSPLKGAHNLAAKTSYVSIEPSGTKVGEFNVQAAECNHPGSARGYRLEYDGNVVVYCPDHEYGEQKMDDGLRELAANADILLQDSTYHMGDIPYRKGWGHSSHLSAVDLALQAEVKTLVLFHHGPDYSDDLLDQMLKEAIAHADGTGLDIVSARDGMVLTVGE